METVVTSAKKEVVISDQRPTVLIGERINPTGKKKLTAALQASDMDMVRQEALAQVEAGAIILDVNAGAVGVDEVAMLPRMVHVVTEVVDVPLCIDSSNPEALRAGLQAYEGKALVNSVTGEERSLLDTLPLVKEFGAAVIGLTMDDDGIPEDPDRRVSIAHKIVDRAEKMGIPRSDIVTDCLTLTVGADIKAGLVTLEAIRKVKAELGTNQTLGAGNISFGLPNRDLLTGVFLSIAIAYGVTCPILDVAKVRPAVLAADLVLGRDSYAMNYIKGFRQSQRQER
jgi:5-methyltetrahydrofolate--homocysteine methyltransferase